MPDRPPASTERLAAWAAPPPTAPSGRPNVLVIVLDDLGFGHLGSYGGEIDTPAFDALADGGLRYNRFHVTAMCSPTRASLLTGRNHHAVGMGLLPDLPLGHAGYTGRIPGSAASLPRLLRDAGYSTYAVGKWHLTPRDERSSSGPFDLWPLGLGFERYYGFLHGDANHWTPLLVRDNHLTEAPARPEDGYHLTEDLADQAIRMLLDQHHATPGKPFFCYLGLGAVHAPHHVAAEWADAYRGRFDDGWEAVRDRTVRRQLELGVVPPGTQPSERPPWVQPWDELPAEHRRAFARQQEVFAGFLTHTDAQIGRILAHLDRTGQLDDTVVLLMSDNGASAEGGRIGSTNEHRFGFTIPETIDEVLAGTADLGGFRSYNHFAWGWAWAGNAPFRLWKRYTWLGGTRVPMIVRGPVGAPDPGGVRDPLCHVVDLFPTVLELCGVEAPDEVDGIPQQPVDGASLVRTLQDPEAGAPRTTQYFELLGSRSIYHERWKATTDHVSSGVLDEDAHLVGSRDFEDDHWALFDLGADFAEANDVSDAHPDVVADLAARWDAEADRNGVLPMEDSLQGRIPSVAPPRHPVPTSMRYLPGGTPVGWESVVSIGGGGRMVASVEVSEGGAEGVLASMGDWSNGWALLVLDGRLTYLLSAVGEPFRLDAPGPLPPGVHGLGFEHHLGPDGSMGQLLIDDRVVAEAPLPPAFGWSNLQIGANGLCVGRGRGFPVIDVYQPPFPWTGVFHHLDIRASGGWFLEPDEELGAAMHRE